MKELIQNIIDWSEAQGIHKKSTALSQRLYAIGELTNEFRDAIAKNKSTEEIKTELGDVLVFYINYLRMSRSYLRMSRSREENIVASLFSLAKQSAWRAASNIDVHISAAVDHSKDPASFLTEVAEIALGIGSTLEECLKLAYDKISKRKGTMQNGKLVKEGD